jgi:peptide deformylase
MTVLKILQDGDAALRVRCEPVTEFDADLATLAADMEQTMFINSGIGLAANQVGVTRRLIVVGLDGSKARALVLVNPIITEAIDYQRTTEGCLSVPREKWQQVVTRRKRIRVEYQTVDGTRKKLKARDLMSSVLQHEIDHLDGILFTDYLRPRVGMHL